MTGFFKGDDLGRKLRGARPRPSELLVRQIEGRVRAARPTERRSLRLAIPATFTAVMLGALAVVGGVGYASSSVESAAVAVSHIFVPAKAHRAVVLMGLTSGTDEYRPGFGFGDPNHTHSGPPGITSKGASTNGAFAPPLTPRIVGPTALVTTSITLDGQAHLYISVLNQTKNKRLLITQKKSTVGSGLSGKQAKTVNYLVLVPRTIPFKIAIPANYLHTGDTYAIRIIAQAPNGAKKTLLIPFSA